MPLLTVPNLIGQTVANAIAKLSVDPPPNGPIPLMVQNGALLRAPVQADMLHIIQFQNPGSGFNVDRNPPPLDPGFFVAVILQLA